MNIYLIGSLRNLQVPVVASKLRDAGHGVFDDWYAAGPTADDSWQAYEQGNGYTLAEALTGHAARHTFELDRKHILRSDAVVLLMPAGKSGHLELGFAVGSGKLGYVLFDKEPERWDVMYCFADDVFTSIEDLLVELAR